MWDHRCHTMGHIPRDHKTKLLFTPVQEHRMKDPGLKGVKQVKMGDVNSITIKCHADLLRNILGKLGLYTSYLLMWTKWGPMKYD